MASNIDRSPLISPPNSPQPRASRYRSVGPGAKYGLAVIVACIFGVVTYIFWPTCHLAANASLGKKHLYYAIDSISIVSTIALPTLIIKKMRNKTARNCIDCLGTCCMFCMG